MQKFIPILLVLLFVSCEKESFENFNNVSSEENNTHTVQKISAIPPISEEKIVMITPEISPPMPPSVKIQEVNKIQTENKKTEPIMPKFSDELLKAVNNWTRIPKSVFPLSAVTIKQAVQFSVKASDGQIMANSILPSGSEVVVVAASGNKLLLAPRKDAKMRGIISMDETDFKEGVAYLFDLRQRQNAEYKEMMKLKEQEQRSQANSAVPNNSKNTNSNYDLFEDIPIPGDFGHGKFCICNDCRSKRLAMKNDD